MNDLVYYCWVDKKLGTLVCSALEHQPVLHSVDAQHRCVNVQGVGAEEGVGALAVAVVSVLSP